MKVGGVPWYVRTMANILWRFLSNMAFQILWSKQSYTVHETNPAPPGMTPSEMTTYLQIVRGKLPTNTNIKRMVQEWNGSGLLPSTVCCLPTCPFPSSDKPGAQPRPLIGQHLAKLSWGKISEETSPGFNFTINPGLIYLQFTVSLL